jgi:hypothetical protein
MYRGNAPPRLDHVPPGPPFRGSFPASPLGPGRACDPESRGRLFFRPLSCVLFKARDRERKEARRKFSLGPPRARGGSAAAPLFSRRRLGLSREHAAVAAERRELTSCSPAREPPQLGAVLFHVFAGRPGCNIFLSRSERDRSPAPLRHGGQRTRSHTREERSEASFFLAPVVVTIVVSTPSFFLDRGRRGRSEDGHAT